ncbi:MAG: hypothetical protein Q8L78_06525 [Coxiellaceae bacterium]|nr:hypothetical protein [Coxiellaceae bacterium]
MMKNPFATLIVNAGQETALTIAFGHDYRQLNKLAFLCEKLAEKSKGTKLDTTFQSIVQGNSDSFDKLKQLYGSIKDAEKLKSTHSLLSKEEENELESTLQDDQNQFQAHCDALQLSMEDAAEQVELQAQLNLIKAELVETESYFRDFYTTASIDLNQLSTATQDLTAAMEALVSADADDDIDALAEKQDDALATVKKLLQSEDYKPDALIAEANDLIKKYDSFSSWLKVIYQQYVTQLATSDNPVSTIDKFLAFLLKKGSEFLPRNYVGWGSTIPAEQKFPSSGSEHDRDKSGHAHFQPCTGHYKQRTKPAGLLASCAPPKAKKSAGVAQETTDAINAKRLQAFLEMLFERQVEHIIELGADKNDIRLIYHSVASGKLISEFDEEENVLILTNTETGITRAIHFTHIPVDDQKALNLANEELSALLNFYNQSKQGTVLAHCDSGVGRTGQIALLLGIQNYFSNNPKVYEKVLLLIEALIHDNPIDNAEVTKLITQLYTTMARILNQLRKIRYSVEQPEQFLSSFAQTLLLSATDAHYPDDEIDLLRERLGVTKPIRIIARHTEEDFSTTTSISASPIIERNAADGITFPGRQETPTNVSPTYEVLQQDKDFKCLLEIPSSNQSSFFSSSPPMAPLTPRPPSAKSLRPETSFPGRRHR